MSTQKRLVIAVDCDDVLMPTAQAIVDDYYRRFGFKIDLNHFYAPAQRATWGTDDEDEAIERVNEFLRSKEHASLAPFPEAVTAIKALAHNHELHLVSGRSDFLRPVTEAMLHKYFPGCFKSIEHTNFIVSSSVQVEKRTKGEVCESIGADIIVDDHLHHAKDALSGNVSRAILFGSYPWSKEDALPQGIVRCSSWPAVIDEVEAYAAR